MVCAGKKRRKGNFWALISCSLTFATAKVKLISTTSFLLLLWRVVSAGCGGGGGDDDDEILRSMTMPTPPAARQLEAFLSASRTRSFLLACLLAFLVKIFFFSPISPEPLGFPPLGSEFINFPSNNVLQRIVKVGEGYVEGPEDICVDKEGTIYTATRDGWVKKLHRNGSWENWKFIGGHSLLGVATSSTGHILLCDADKGLLRVGEDGVAILASHVNGSKIRFVDDVIESSDGTVYFSDASTKFGFDVWHLDLLEAKPHGRLLKYDPSTKETTIVLDNLRFANGVALSKDQDFLVVCETWKFRCLKHWLKGEMKGKTEIFVDKLPGGPDNINLAPDGSFWIAVLELRNNPVLELINKSKLAKRFVANFPKLKSNIIASIMRKATVMNVGIDGNVIKMLDDSSGEVMSFVTSAMEFEKQLYVGSLSSNFIGKLKLI
ncbi:PREDICTED: protein STRICTOSIDINE SYNTHASE-LIKE 4-like isoform X2 [Nelumbo nucifera]|uniref:Protein STRICTOSIDINE SYNTHASE-LIKE 4-like isoform X2 n=1 Tax=Nelumbo nucifera TaxID=4432 RepID=A0A1U8A9H3_NELNU|nr:PREDICTED: protein STRICTOSIDINE SYNTHASE-LIKE 4-like isoform X2 [Nelumbo nucifera]